MSSKSYSCNRSFHLSIRARGGSFVFGEIYIPKVYDLFLIGIFYHTSTYENARNQKQRPKPPFQYDHT